MLIPSDDPLLNALVLGAEEEAKKARAEEKAKKARAEQKKRNKKICCIMM